VLLLLHSSHTLHVRGVLLLLHSSHTLHVRGVLLLLDLLYVVLVVLGLVLHGLLGSEPATN
jgi:hypothetical protein